MTPEDIAKAAGHKNSKNVVSFEYAIRGLRGDTPARNIKFQSREQMIFTAERILESTTSTEVKEYLQGKLKEVVLKPSKRDSSSSLPTSTASEATPLQAAMSTDAKTDNVPASVESGVESRPGVYVYSYPQYLSMESINPEGRGLYKIGASGSIARRVERQRRQTEVPEDLVLVRAFYSDEPFELEAKFHSILKAANMHQKTTQGGIEWFSCPLAMIDAIAKAIA